MENKYKLGKLFVYYQCQVEDVLQVMKYIIYDVKRNEYRYIKNDNIREYKIRRELLDEIEEIDTNILRDDTIRRDCSNIDALLYYYFFSMLNNKYYGDEVYSRIKHYLYGKCGV